MKLFMEGNFLNLMKKKDTISKRVTIFGQDQIEHFDLGKRVEHWKWNYDPSNKLSR